MRALCLVAGYYRIAAQAEVIAKQLALGAPAVSDDLLRAAKLVGLKARQVPSISLARLSALPTPAIACFADGGFAIFAGATSSGACG